jgi:ABC-type branched-subunit amino acid transport system substrate-binding protein
MFVQQSSHTASWILILVAALFLVCNIPIGVSAGDSIKIGMIDDFSGRSSAIANDALHSWKMVLDAFSSRGGLNGTKLEIVTADDKFNAQTASQLAEKLIVQDKVHFLGGSSSSDHSLTADKGHEYVFRSCANSEIEGRTGGKYAAFKKYSKWFIIGEDYEYGRSVVNSFWQSRGLLSARPFSASCNES